MNGSNESCVDNLTYTQHEVLAGVMISASAFATAACLAAIALIIIIRIYRVFLIRLVLYFMIIMLAEATLITARGVLYKSDGSTVNIKVSSYILTTIEWMRTLATVWITTYLFLLVVFKVQLNKIQQEIAGLLSVVLIPLSFTWTQYSFGFAPKYMWTCFFSSVPRKTLIIFLIYRLPLLFLTFACFSAVSLMAGVLCKRWRANHYRYELQRQHWSVLREVLPFIVYPAISCVCFTTDCLLHLYYILAYHEDATMSFWLVLLHDIPYDDLLLPLVLIFNPNTYRLLKRVRSRNQQMNNVTSRNETELLFSQSTKK